MKTNLVSLFLTIVLAATVSPYAGKPEVKFRNGWRLNHVYIGETWQEARRWLGAPHKEWTLGYTRIHDYSDDPDLPQARPLVWTRDGRVVYIQGGSKLEKDGRQVIATGDSISQLRTVLGTPTEESGTSGFAHYDALQLEVRHSNGRINSFDLGDELAFNKRGRASTGLLATPVVDGVAASDGNEQR